MKTLLTLASILTAVLMMSEAQAAGCRVELQNRRGDLIRPFIAQRCRPAKMQCEDARARMAPRRFGRTMCVVTRRPGTPGPRPLPPVPRPSRVQVFTQSVNYCIGDRDRCPSRSATVYLPRNAQVLEITFYAHDRIGSKTDGKINVSVDSTRVATYINAKSEGRTHVVQTNAYGSMITFTQSVDDVFIGNVQVKYRR